MLVMLVKITWVLIYKWKRLMTRDVELMLKSVWWDMILE